jgi:hypothetical protein
MLDRRIGHGAIREDDRVHAFVTGRAESLCGAGVLAVRMPGAFHPEYERACEDCTRVVRENRGRTDPGPR